MKKEKDEVLKIFKEINKDATELSKGSEMKKERLIREIERVDIITTIVENQKKANGFWRRFFNHFS